jgi:hypothetical protein
VDKIDTLLNRYIDSAVQHGKSTEDGDYKSANKAFKTLKKTFVELKDNKDYGVEKLLCLLKHEEAYVRLWAAAHTLQVNPNAAKKTLNQLTKLPGFIGFTARMTIDEWEKGKLRY